MSSIFRRRSRPGSARSLLVLATACAVLVFTPLAGRAEVHIYGADHETGEVVKFKEDGTIYVSECRSARIRVISPDRTSFRFITSPAMKHAATIAVVEASP